MPEIVLTIIPYSLWSNSGFCFLPLRQIFRSRKHAIKKEWIDLVDIKLTKLRQVI